MYERIPVTITWNTPNLLKIPGVRGFSEIIHPRVRNSVTCPNEPTFRVYVDQKRSKSYCQLTRRLIPESFQGVPTDVHEVGDVVAQQDIHLRRTRPILGGLSFGHWAITAGTLGIVLLGADDNKPRILSNLHVIFNADNPPTCAKPGDQCLQPGPYDEGHQDEDLVATSDRYVELLGYLPGGIGDMATAQ